MAWLAILLMTLWLTGVGMHVWTDAEGVLEIPEWQQGARHAATVAHGVLAWLVCLAAGRWIWPHVGLVWHRRHHANAWWLGMLLMLCGTLVAVGGLLLLYGSPKTHEIAEKIHWWLGLTLPLIVAVHAGWRWRHHRHPASLEH